MQNIQFSISNCRAAASFVDYSILGIGYWKLEIEKKYSMQNIQ
jgi:hypothetical protein